MFLLAGHEGGKFTSTQLNCFKITYPSLQEEKKKKKIRALNFHFRQWKRGWGVVRPGLVTDSLLHGTRRGFLAFLRHRSATPKPAAPTGASCPFFPVQTWKAPSLSLCAGIMAGLGGSGGAPSTLLAAPLPAAVIPRCSSYQQLSFPTWITEEICPALPILGQDHPSSQVLHGNNQQQLPREAAGELCASLGPPVGGKKSLAMVSKGWDLVLGWWSSSVNLKICFLVRKWHVHK